VNVELFHDSGLIQAETPVSRQVFAWPGSPHVRRCLVHALRCSVLFAVVYGGADLFARLHTHRVSSYLPIDDTIPLVPSATLVYSSLWLMFAGAPFVLRREAEIARLARVIQLEIAIAGVFFLAAPMPDRPASGDLGLFAGAFRAADFVNLEFNQFPSLHAAFGFTLSWIVGLYCSLPGRLLMLTWGLAIGIAAVLTWQHAVLDVVGGAILAAAALRLAPRPAQQ
jgi:membrane-associated phospholipid phosphatase